MLVDVLIALTLFGLGVQLYHYLIYPALLAGLCVPAWFFQRQPGPARYRPMVSIITPAYNEADCIERKIENSLALSYERKEIIVISDGSTDGTQDIIAGFHNRGVISEHYPVRQGKGHALNRGLALSRGDIIVISDARGRYALDAVDRLVEQLSDPKVGCVSGHILIESESAEAGHSNIGDAEGFYWRYESLIKKLESRLASTTGVIGACMALRRELCDRISPNIINDDLYIAMQVMKKGYRVVYAPAAVCYENPVHTFHDDALRRKRITAGRFHILFRPKLWPWNDPLSLFFLLSHKLLRLLLPFCLMLAFIANSVVIWLPETPMIMYVLLGGQVLFVCAAGLGYVSRSARGIWRFPRVIWFIANGYLSTLRGFAAYLSGAQTVLWERAER